MGLIEANSDSIAHLILAEADLEFSGFTMTTANNPNNNLSPLAAGPEWQPKWPAKRHQRPSWLCA